MEIVDSVLIFDNSEGKHSLIAEKMEAGALKIINQTKFEQLRRIYDDHK
ncbi:putative ABC-type ATPase [Niabella hirudinis]